MVKTNSLKAWVLAARPKTLTGAIAPVLVGGAFAYARILHYTPNSSILQFFNSSILQFSNSSLLLCLLFAILM
jgi:1,4-dihydroxy-2-naphthoate octaprenyltransferase